MAQRSFAGTRLEFGADRLAIGKLRRIGQSSRIRAQLAIRCVLADQAEEAGSGPMGPGDGMCDLGQRWKGFPGVFEAVFRHRHLCVLPRHSRTSRVPGLSDVSGVTAMLPLPFSSL